MFKNRGRVVDITRIAKLKATKKNPKLARKYPPKNSIDILEVIERRGYSVLSSTIVPDKYNIMSSTIRENKKTYRPLGSLIRLKDNSYEATIVYIPENLSQISDANDFRYFCKTQKIPYTQNHTRKELVDILTEDFTIDENVAELIERLDW